MSSLAQDVRFGWRMLLRRPLMTFVSLLSLVVGMSASMVVFGLLNAAVLRPLPVAAPNELAVVLEQRPANVNHNFSFRDYNEFREAQRVFTDLVAFSRTRVTVGGPDGSEIITGEMVTGAYFPTFGLRMRLGRGLVQADDQRDAPPVAVVSESFWRRLDSPPLDGWSISLNTRTFSVVGVAAAPFGGMEIGRDARVWVPLRFQPVLASAGARNLLAPDAGSWLTLMGRLRPGVTIELAGRELTQVESVLPKWPNRPRTRRLFAAPGAQGDSRLPAAAASPLHLLLAAAGLVLLVACANVAGLLTARATERERELAVRTALGASRSRLARLLFVEVGLIGAGAITLAIGVSIAATRLVARLITLSGESVAVDVSLDWRVASFAAALALGSSLVFGLIPLASIRRSLSPALAESSRGASASRGKGLARRLLVVGQFALSLALVAVSVLLGRTFYNLRTLPTGFDLDHVAVAEVDPRAAQYGPERVSQYMVDATARLSALPGVRRVGSAQVLALDFGGLRQTISIPGYTAPDGEDMRSTTTS